MTTMVQKEMLTKARTMVYWITTGMVIGVQFIGGLMDLLHGPEFLVGDFFIQNTQRLGYPLYLLTLLGCWKLLGALALLLPGFPRLKEWAYAGTFFNMTGAAFSYAVCIDYLNMGILLSIAGITLVSWGLRPHQHPAKRFTIVPQS